MADYSKKFKRRVVILWIRHNMSSSEISRLSGIDHKTLLKWYKRFYPEIAVWGVVQQHKDTNWHNIGMCAGYYK